MRMSLRPLVVISMPAAFAWTLEASVPLDSGVMWTPDRARGPAVVGHHRDRGGGEGAERCDGDGQQQCETLHREWHVPLLCSLNDVQRASRAGAAAASPGQAILARRGEMARAGQRSQLLFRPA